MRNRTAQALACLCGALVLAACERPAAPKAEAMLERTQATLAEATEKTQEQLALAAQKTHEALAGDGGIVASIKADLVKDPDLSALAIDVDARDGVVTLQGLAPDEEARARAGRIAGATKGVREVRNRLATKQG